nr:hypothetical protein CFP56_55966 [Quercus suber]
MDRPAIAMAFSVKRTSADKTMGLGHKASRTRNMSVKVRSYCSTPIRPRYTVFRGGDDAADHDSAVFGGGGDAEDHDSTAFGCEFAFPWTRAHTSVGMPSTGPRDGDGWGRSANRDQDCLSVVESEPQSLSETCVG